MLMCIKLSLEWFFLLMYVAMNQIADAEIFDNRNRYDNFGTKRRQALESDWYSSHHITLKQTIVCYCLSCKESDWFLDGVLCYVYEFYSMPRNLETKETKYHIVMTTK